MRAISVLIVFLVVLQIDSRSTVTELELSSSKKIDVDSGPVKFRISFNFTIEEGDQINNIKLWYGGAPLDRAASFACSAWNQAFEYDSSKVPELLGPPPYEVSNTKCDRLPIGPRLYFSNISSRLEVEVTYSPDSLSAPTNTWIAALSNVNDEIVTVTPQAITTVGLFPQNLSVNITSLSDGTVAMVFRCAVGPVIPDVLLTHTLPAAVSVEPAQGYNDVKIRVPYNSSLNGNIYKCVAHIQYPSQIELQQSMLVEYAPFYVRNSVSISCEAPCEVTFELCSAGLVAFPTPFVSWQSIVIDKPNENGDAVMTTLCIAKNSVGIATKRITTTIGSAFPPDDRARAEFWSSPSVIAVISVPWILLVITAVALFIFFKFKKHSWLEKHCERPSWEQRRPPPSSSEIDGGSAGYMDPMPSINHRNGSVGGESENAYVQLSAPAASSTRSHNYEFIDLSQVVESTESSQSLKIPHTSQAKPRLEPSNGDVGGNGNPNGDYDNSNHGNSKHGYSNPEQINHAYSYPKPRDHGYDSVPPENDAEPQKTSIHEYLEISSFVAEVLATAAVPFESEEPESNKDKDGLPIQHAYVNVSPSDTHN